MKDLAAGGLHRVQVDAVRDRRLRPALPARGGPGKMAHLVDVLVLYVYFGLFSLWSFGYKMYLVRPHTSTRRRRSRSRPSRRRSSASSSSRTSRSTRTPRSARTRWPRWRCAGSRSSSPGGRRGSGGMAMPGHRRGGGRAAARPSSGRSRPPATPPASSRDGLPRRGRLPASSGPAHRRGARRSDRRGRAGRVPGDLIVDQPLRLLAGGGRASWARARAASCASAPTA